MMKDMFICLLLNLKTFGDITSANMFNKGYSAIDLVSGDDEYHICITKKEKEKKEND